MASLCATPLPPPLKVPPVRHRAGWAPEPPHFLGIPENRP